MTALVDGFFCDYRTHAPGGLLTSPAGMREMLYRFAHSDPEPGDILGAVDWPAVVARMKPGAHAVIVAHDEWSDVVSASARAAGLEIRDSIPIYSASGDERAIVARKPLEDAIARHVLRWGVGPINIGATRVGTGTGEEQPEKRPNFKNYVYGRGLGGAAWVNSDGRWPPNALMRHSDGCTPDGVRSVKSPGGGRGEPPRLDGVLETGYRQRVPTVYGNSDGREMVEVWSCVAGCPVRELDGQSGETRSAKSKVEHDGYDGESRTGLVRGVSNPGNQYDDAGGASRFFPHGSDHDLLRWLVRLVLPPDGTALLDGETFVAAARAERVYLSDIKTG
jgi:hypothetical protein